MPINDIEKRIITEAEAEAEKIKEEASDKASIILSDAEEEASKLREEILEQAKNKAEEEKRKIISPSRIKAKNDLLEKKQELIKQVFDEALKEMSNWKDKDYKKTIKTLLRDIPKEGNILPAQDKEKIISKALSEAKIKKIKVLKGTSKIKGGFIFEGKKINIDCSFETYIAHLREKIEPEIIEILFGKEK